jgi:hypothetical protein
VWDAVPVRTDATGTRRVIKRADDAQSFSTRRIQGWQWYHAALRRS